MRNTDKTIVAASEFARNVAHWRDEAREHPVYIATHNRISQVLMGIAHYDSLNAGSHVTADDVAARDETIRMISDWMDEAVIVCDEAMIVLFANRVASAICHKPAQKLENLPLTEALPEIVGTLLEVQVRRTMVGSEPSAADIPSPFTRDAWLRLQTFPVGKRNVLMFRDITEDVVRHRLADVKSAMVEAMDVEGSVSYARVSLRGTIDRASVRFCIKINLPEERLVGVPISDLISIEDRVRFRETLEAVLRGGDPVAATFRFLSNSDGPVPCRVSMVQLHGAYGAEGAVLLITRSNQDD